ncbi:unnamed protein product [Schistocephalus solidus]|uniref:Non-reducing end alpha-L-arabinofuranosidase n=1 Tax=Schistocephalus solidus TaxID=70667 RepID=A0A183T7D2_SCHSO|nr:unnamed protein product [Schistocephalus solidus]
MSQVFNFDAVAIEGRGEDCTSRQTIEAWMPTNRSFNRHVDLPAPYLVLRTLLTEERQDVEQSGLPIIFATNEDCGGTSSVERPADSTRQRGR